MNAILAVPHYLLEHLDAVYTFFLVVLRFTGFFLIVPGLGEGVKGSHIRTPAALTFSFVGMGAVPVAPLPADIVSMLGQMIVEFALGYAIGILPTIVIVGIQTGAQLATGTMGLGASQLIDPTTGGSLSSLSRLQGDMVTAIFLLGGGHYILIPALLGLSGPFLPGTFQFTGLTTELLVNRFGDIFRVAALASAPVIIALLLTQFVMGLITKAVPTVNIFIVSFPLTVGIGFVLTMAAIPEMARFAYKELSGLEKASLIIIDDQQMADSSTNPTP